MVRGMPLNEMHLRPTSRMSSAAARGVIVELDEGDVATWWRMEREAGELRVNVAAALQGRWSAVCDLELKTSLRLGATHRQRQPRPRAISPLPRFAGDPLVDVLDLAGSGRLAGTCKRRIDEPLECGRELRHGCSFPPALGAGHEQTTMRIDGRKEMTKNKLRKPLLQISNSSIPQIPLP